MRAHKRQERLVATAMLAERVVAIQERKRSHAAGGHDNRPKRVRTRATAKAAAIREW